MVVPPNTGPSGPPGGSGPGNGPSSVAAPPSASAARLADLLDFVRQEFDLVGNDAATLKVQRDEFDHRSERESLLRRGCRLLMIISLLSVGQQVNEVQMMQQHIMELEQRHTSMAQQ
jgi:glucose repression regulatory protein TUP1